MAGSAALGSQFCCFASSSAGALLFWVVLFAAPAAEAAAPVTAAEQVDRRAPCEDQDDKWKAHGTNCTEMMRLCGDDGYGQLVRTWCPKTCGLCPSAREAWEEEAPSSTTHSAAVGAAVGSEQSSSEPVEEGLYRRHVRRNVSANAGASRAATARALARKKNFTNSAANRSAAKPPIAAPRSGAGGHNTSRRALSKAQPGASSNGTDVGPCAGGNCTNSSRSSIRPHAAAARPVKKALGAEVALEQLHRGVSLRNASNNNSMEHPTQRTMLRFLLADSVDGVQVAQVMPAAGSGSATNASAEASWLSSGTVFLADREDAEAVPGSSQGSRGLALAMAEAFNLSTKQPYIAEFLRNATAILSDGPIESDGQASEHFRSTAVAEDRIQQIAGVLEEKKKICPAGYELMIGDVYGGDQWGERAKRTFADSAADCAQRCTRTPGCGSFEYSPSLKRCFRNTQTRPTHAEQRGDFLFCRRRPCPSFRTREDCVGPESPSAWHSAEVSLRPGSYCIWSGGACQAPMACTATDCFLPDGGLPGMELPPRYTLWISEPGLRSTFAPGYASFSR